MKYLLPLLIILTFIACKSDDDATDPDYDGLTLVWSEEFNDNISSEHWNFELGDGTDYGHNPGWGNNERQLYTNSSNNVLIRADEDGNSVLDIIARKEPGDHKYSSAKLTTQNLHSFRFGRIEARIKVPEGKGMWPAFWLLGDNAAILDWPGCGEIDIMEVIGDQPHIYHSTVHFANFENKKGEINNPFEASQNLSNDYHEYRLDWTPEAITFSLDGQEVHQLSIEDDMKEFLRSAFIILNVAVGGNWPGDPDETTVFPQHMLVDWVRAYEIDDLSPPVAPELNIEEETIGSISFGLAAHGMNSTLNQFSDITLKAYGAGGEPTFTSSDITIEGDSSILLMYRGTNWGGAFFVLDPVVDASQYANGNLKFSLNAPTELANMEIKLESVGTNASEFLQNYTGVNVGNGFLEYTIPMSNFEGLSLTDLKIPFALWNPKDENGDYIAVDVILDNIYFEE